MIPRFQNTPLDDQERQVIGHVEVHGWNVTNVRSEQGPGWSYTIGLFESYGHPEVIIFGMNEQGRHSILNWIGENVREGKKFQAGQEHDWVLESYNRASRVVQQQWYRDLVGWAIWFYGGQEFPLVQCLWPSRNGQYPWEPSQAFQSSQPLLYEVDVLSAQAADFVSAETLAGADWPFADDLHLGVFVSRCVVEDGAPIVRVVHDTDGDWQFIGPVEDPAVDGCKLICFHCVLEREPRVRDLARLPRGWRASREHAESAWTMEERAELPE